MKIWTFEGGYDKNFTYIFSNGNFSEAAIVDAAVHLNQLHPIIHSRNLHPRYLLVTHTHGDHIVYVREYLNAYPDVEICIFGKKNHYPNQKQLQDSDTITMGALKILVIHTPGHYSDCVCYFVNNTLFTGDTLFVGRTGRTISAGSDTRELYRSVYQKILTLPDDTIIYPGHNYGLKPTITLGENRRISPLLQARSEDDFVKRMGEYERSRIVD